jgi:hypothetical protein
MILGTGVSFLGIGGSFLGNDFLLDAEPRCGGIGDASSKDDFAT